MVHAVTRDPRGVIDLAIGFQQCQPGEEHTLTPVLWQRPIPRLQSFTSAAHRSCSCQRVNRVDPPKPPDLAADVVQVILGFHRELAR